MNHTSADTASRDAPRTAPDARLRATIGLQPPGTPAPAWATTTWFNTAGAPLDLEALRGRVVVLHAFQMLCPGCVQHGLPQAQRIAAVFGENSRDVAVVGLHTVFEHHDAMTPVSLEAFLHEYRVRFPVGVDAPADAPTPTTRDPIPKTMHAYGLRGTPSLLLIDRRGDLRWHGFGAADDMVVAAAITTLLLEESDAARG
jgi:hypothetical protein